MNKLEERRLEERIETLREKLNQQKNIREEKTYHLSRELDKLIFEAMKNDRSR
ncbi:MAG: Spo0E family sporulation regulatory protein-aspartic acid phosphatase [Bacillota bacterium]